MEKNAEDYKLYKSIDDETLEGCVWGKGKYIENTKKEIKFVTIKNVTTDEKITCILREINTDFLEKYNNNKPEKHIDENSKPIVISYYYRHLLGIPEIESGDTHKLVVYPPSLLEKNYNMYMKHPSPYIRYGMWLGFLLLGLAMIPLLLLKEISIFLINQTISFYQLSASSNQLPVNQRRTRRVNRAQ